MQFDEPSQMKPSPVNPSKHRQVKLPTAFSHVAFEEQALRLRHSFTSKKQSLKDIGVEVLSLTI